METICNEELRVTVSSVGAEIQQATDVRTGTEYMWQGDARYWSGRSPILFPAVGGLWNATCRVGGKAYPLPKHGFVRLREWDVLERRPDSVTFGLSGTEADLAAFPWPYALRVRYTLRGRSVEAAFEVDNPGTEEMFFQMGGHPGIALPDFSEDELVSGFLKLEGELRGVLRAGEQGCTGPERFPVPLTADGLVPLSVETFANEALIFDGGQIKAATVLGTDRRPLARVESTAPVWLFWSPQGVHSPFVCAEPWYGLCDPIGFEGDVSQRPFINRLAPGQTWRGGFVLTLCQGSSTRG